MARAGQSGTDNAENASTSLTTNTATINGVIQNSVSGTSAALGKSGVGTLILNNTNTYNGGTYVGAGVLEATHSGALGTGNVFVNAGSALSLNAFNNLATGKTVTLNNSVLDIAFAGATTSTIQTILNSSSTGVLALDANQAAALNLTQLSTAGKLYLAR